MAEMRVSAILPTIKCSNCSVDIPISQLGDHVCSKAPPAPATRLDVLSGPFSPRKKSPLGLSASRKPPPRLETIGSSNSLSSIRLPFSSTSSGESSPRTVSPVPSLSGRKSPYLPPSRSQTSPLPSRPPSDDVTLPQDGAFPMFPTTRSRSTTPTQPPETKPPFSRTQTEPIRNRQNTVDQVPKSNSGTEASVMLQKLNGLSSGRFSAKKEVGEGLALKGHRKSPSMGSSKDFSSRPTSTATVKSHNRKTSTSSSVYTRVRSVSTVSGNSRFGWNAPDVPAVPPTMKQQDHNTLQDSQTLPTVGDEKKFDFGLDQASKSEEKKDDIAEVAQPVATPQPQPPEPSIHTHKPRPSVSAAMAPLDSIGSSSSFKPSRSIRGRKLSSATTRPTARELSIRTTSQDAPPVPAAFQSKNCSLESSSHTPNESTSSNGSYSSGVRTGSSRSSPPLQESPQRQKPPSLENGYVDNSFSGFKFGVEEKSQVPESMPPPQERQPLSEGPAIPPQPNPPSQMQSRHAPQPEFQTLPPPPFEEPRPYAPPYRADYDRRGLRDPPSRVPSLSTEPTLPDVEPQEPPLQQISPQTTSPDDYMISSVDSQDYSHHFHYAPALPQRQHIPAPPGVPPPQRSRLPDKGPCRGCREPIRGKSVSSADGRLTGKYHKGCFVCTTCGNPFLTADFYVLRNHPYCARHYHELNNSLCQGCNRGIEGQYLETETYRKFHSYCFTCQECHKILRDDFFEWKGRTLCEQHAFRAAQMPSSGLGFGAGRKFPERRTTKLMMMM